MHEHFIIQLLGIKDTHVELWDFDMGKKEISVSLHTKVKRHKCLKCGEWTRRVHGYRNQKIRGRLIEEKPVIIDLRKRRYLCLNCGHTFYERLFFVDRYQRHTISLEQQAMTYVADHSFKTVGKMVGLSTKSIQRLFDKRQIQVSKVLPLV